MVGGGEILNKFDGIRRVVIRLTLNATPTKFGMYRPSFQGVLTTLSCKLLRPGLATAIFGAADDGLRCSLVDQAAPESLRSIANGIRRQARPI